MPPKYRFNKEEIINTALNLVRKDGFSALTARKLGMELGMSSHPVFSAFKNMEELQSEVVKAARALYNSYIEKGLAEEFAFKGVGLQYLNFAKEEPHLFQLLFMAANESERTLEELLPALDDNSDRILMSIIDRYGFSREQSYRIYRDLWIFTHGIACLYITGVSRLTEEQSYDLLKEMFISLLIKIRNEAPA